MSLLNHEHILRFYEAYNDDDNFVIVLEYMKGGTLFDRVSKKRRYQEKDAAFVIKNLMIGLEYLHQKGIVHRDIKLENIFMPSETSDIAIKLGDFDLANFVALINHTKQCGTPGYMAPEVFYKHYGGYSPKTDIFSSGVVLYAM